METNVPMIRQLIKVSLNLGAWGVRTQFEDLSKISRRLYELEAIYGGGVRAPGGLVDRFRSLGCTDEHDGRRDGYRYRPEQRGCAGCESHPEERIKGRPTRNEDEQGRSLPVLFADAGTLHSVRDGHRF